MKSTLLFVLAYASTLVSAFYVPPQFVDQTNGHHGSEDLRMVADQGKLRNSPEKPLREVHQQTAADLVKNNENDDQAIDAWQVYTHKSFPKYAIRTREKVKLCDPSVKQVVGYLDVDETKHFFFWFFESRNSPASDPLVLWLNGGPGCSSLTGLLMELGPCRVNKNGNGTTYNEYSWNNHANVIFLDQPVNAGFSYTDGEPVNNSDDAAEDVYAFLQLFLGKFKQYSKLDFHVTGESYAGHYIPAIGKSISDNNAILDPDNKEFILINLKSLAIGNGLTDPYNQYESYPDMACNNSYGPVVDQATCDEMRSKVGTCKNLIQGCYKWQSRFTCVPSAIYCNNALIGPVAKSGANVYDVRMKCEPGNNLCYPIIRDIESWANSPEVQAALGVDREFKSCNMDVNLKFLMAGDWSKPYVNDLPPLLEEGVRVLIYAGDADYICNWMGNKAWSLALDWFGREEFNAAKDKAVKSNYTGKDLGEYRSYANFAFLKVYGAGHMVPYDQPEHSLEFITKWLYSKE